MACLVVSEIQLTFKSTQLPPVDNGDARNILDAFTRYLDTMRDPDSAIEMLVLPFAMTYHSVSNCLPDEVVSLLESVLNRTWRFMEEENLAPQEMMLSAFKYAGSALRSFS